MLAISLNLLLQVITFGQLTKEDIARRVLDAQKRRRGEDQNPAAKRAFIAWNREHARACDEEDYRGYQMLGDITSRLKIFDNF
jgi:hypothetical protein